MGYLTIAIPHVLLSTSKTVSTTQMIGILMLDSSVHTHHCRRLAYPLARIPARLKEVCDWMHLHTTGLAPATFRQLAWHTLRTLHCTFRPAYSLNRLCDPFTQSASIHVVTP